jgi:hypothetical protein
MPDTTKAGLTTSTTIGTSDDLNVVKVGSLEIVKNMADGKISLRDVMIKDHITGVFRAANQLPEGQVPDHGLVPPETISFFKGNCVYFNQRWYC